MRPSADLDRRLAAWLDEDASVPAPERVLAGALARTARTRPRPAWLVPERWIPMRVSMALAVVPRAALIALTLLVLLALAASALVVGSPSPGPLPAPTGLARNGLIAYSDPGGENVVGGHIWLVDERGEQRQRLTSGPEHDVPGAWSPNGTWLAYWSQVRGEWPQSEWELRVIRPGEEEPRTLASGLYSAQRYDVGCGTDIAWSPDGTTIAYAHRLPSDGGSTRPPSQIDLVSVDGGPARMLVEHGRAPRWSPDGQAIAYASTDEVDRTIGIALVPITGGEPRQLSRPSSRQSSLFCGLQGLEWSPDGQRIAFHAQRADDGRVHEGSDEPLTTFEVRIVEADGAGETVVTSASDSEAFPRWSPDGGRLALIRGFVDFSGSQVVVGAPDGSGQLVALDSPTLGSSVTWSPDGTRLLDASDGVSVVDPSGTLPPVRLGPGAHATWQRLAP